MAKPLLNIKLQRAISHPIFDRFLKTWHRFDQGKELFEMSIHLAHYEFYFKIWVFEPNNLSRSTQVPIWARGPKIPSKVSETNVVTWSIVILKIIFGNDNTWLPPLKWKKKLLDYLFLSRNLWNKSVSSRIWKNELRTSYP